MSLLTGVGSQPLLLHNCKVVPCQLSGKDWLSGAPRGAYTAARTVGQQKIFELSFHISRLAESVRLMGERGNCDGIYCANPPPRISDPQLLRPELLDVLRTAASEYIILNPQHKGELRIIVLLTWGDQQTQGLIQNGKQSKQQYDMYVHLEPLPGPPSPPIKVLVKGHPRDNPIAKDSEWVRDRVELEKDKPKDINEVLLMDSNNGVLEGMTSNFFAVENGIVVTPGEGILEGSVRDLVLRVCQETEIPVQLRPPNLSCIDEWEGAFITSTSRLVLKIDQLDAVSGVTKKFGDCEVINLVKDQVLEKMEQNSEYFC